MNNVPRTSYCKMLPNALQRIWSALLNSLARLHPSFRQDIHQCLVKRFWSFFLTIIRRLFASNTSTCSRCGDEQAPNPTSISSPPSLCSGEEKLTNIVAPVTSVILASSVTPGQIAQPIPNTEMVPNAVAETTPNSQHKPAEAYATDSIPQSTTNTVTRPGRNITGSKPFQVGKLFPVKPGDKKRWWAQADACVCLHLARTFRTHCFHL